MEQRIIRFENGLWNIRTDSGKLHESEREELMEYLDEIMLPYRLMEGCLYIEGSVSRSAVFEQLEHFYDGRANVFPF